MNETTNKQLKKYLRTRALPSPWQLTGNERKDFSAAVVIPALAEEDSLPRTLAALARNPAAELSRTLVLIVINNRPTATKTQQQENQRTLKCLQSYPLPELNLAWVDASSPGFELPEREGVGMARKVGFDLALACLDWTCRPLLISLDADTLVDANYLPAIFAHFDASPKGGATIPFRHQPGETVAQEAAIRRYELYLRSYLFGLQQAGSPYAYHSIGSAFACAAEAYLAAGGMNRRQAAEDFYFLQQLAKTTGVEMLAGTVVRPSARFSARVPFGTGNAVQGQVEEGREAFKFTSTAAFQLLQAWLCAVEQGWECSAEELQRHARQLSAILADFLEELNFRRNWQKLQANHCARTQRIAAFHAWFDGLRTRQLLARLDEDKVCERPKLLTELLEWGGYMAKRCEGEQLETLETLQGVR